MDSLAVTAVPVAVLVRVAAHGSAVVAGPAELAPGSLAGRRYFAVPARPGLAADRDHIFDKRDPWGLSAPHSLDRTSMFVPCERPLIAANDIGKTATEILIRCRLKI